MQIELTWNGQKPAEKLSRQIAPAKPRTALQRETSRKNGSMSKGPKTPAGKARSARNALRHGLSASAIPNPAFRQQVVQLAHAIAGDSADAAELGLAILIAAAQIDIGRARHAACAVMSKMAVESPASATYGKAVRRLDWIKRHEHRCALSRDKAIRQLREWRIAAMEQPRNNKTNPTPPDQVEAVAAAREYTRATSCARTSGCPVFTTAARPDDTIQWWATRFEKTNPTAGGAKRTNANTTVEHCNRRARSLTERTRERSGFLSEKTNLTKTNRAPVRTSRLFIPRRLAKCSLTKPNPGRRTPNRPTEPPHRGMVRNTAYSNRGPPPAERRVLLA